MAVMLCDAGTSQIQHRDSNIPLDSIIATDDFRPASSQIQSSADLRDSRNQSMASNPLVCAELFLGGLGRGLKPKSLF